MLQTWHPIVMIPIGSKQINYTVWSDVFVCQWSHEMVFWKRGADQTNHRMRRHFIVRVAPSKKAH